MKNTQEITTVADNNIIFQSAEDVENEVIEAQEAIKMNWSFWLTEEQQQVVIRNPEIFADVVDHIKSDRLSQEEFDLQSTHSDNKSREVLEIDSVKNKVKKLLKLH